MGGVRRKGDVPAPKNILSYRTAPDVGSSVTDFNETLVRRTHAAAAMCSIARHTCTLLIHTVSPANRRVVRLSYVMHDQSIRYQSALSVLSSSLRVLQQSGLEVTNIQREDAHSRTYIPHQTRDLASFRVDCPTPKSHATLFEIRTQRNGSTARVGRILSPSDCLGHPSYITDCV